MRLKPGFENYAEKGARILVVESYAKKGAILCRNKITQEKVPF